MDDIGPLKRLKETLLDKRKKMTTEKIRRAADALSKVLPTKPTSYAVEQKLRNHLEAPRRIERAAEARCEAAKRTKKHAIQMLIDITVDLNDATEALCAKERAFMEDQQRRQDAFREEYAADTERFERVYKPQVAKWVRVRNEACEMINATPQWQEEHTTKCVEATIERLGGNRPL